EQRENQVVKMKAFPVGVFELAGQKTRRGGAAHPVQRRDQRIRADDPEHVEPAQGIDGHEALTGGGGRRGRWGGLSFSQRGHGDLLCASLKRSKACSRSKRQSEGVNRVKWGDKSNDESSARNR